MIRKCKNCKIDFHSVRSNSKYCSRTCFFNAAKRRGTKTCTFCKTRYEVRRYYLKKGRSKFCSMKCSADSRRRGGIDSQGYRRFSLNKVVYLEHRVVMEQKLSRKLRSDEDVHHKNLIRSDNRPSNLQLKWVHHGRGALVKDLVAYLRATGYSVVKD